jgi:hypothetical protein
VHNAGCGHPRSPRMFGTSLILKRRVNKAVWGLWASSLGHHCIAQTGDQGMSSELAPRPRKGFGAQKLPVAGGVWSVLILAFGCAMWSRSAGRSSSAQVHTTDHMFEVLWIKSLGMWGGEGCRFSHSMQCTCLSARALNGAFPRDDGSLGCCWVSRLTGSGIALQKTVGNG